MIYTYPIKPKIAKTESIFRSQVRTSDHWTIYVFEILFRAALITCRDPYISFVIIKENNLSRVSASSDAAKSLHLNYLALWRHSLSDWIRKLLKA